MKKQKHAAPTPHQYSILRQICNYIPAFLVPKLAHATKVDEKARTFSPPQSLANSVGIHPKVKLDRCQYHHLEEDAKHQ
jgi:hypothetical protein